MYNIQTEINLWDKCREINIFPFEVLVAWRQKITLLGGSVAWEGKLKPAQLQLKLSRSFCWPWRQLAIQLALLFLLKLECLILQSHTSWIGTDWLRLWIINILLCLLVGQKMSLDDIYLYFDNVIGAWIVIREKYWDLSFWSTRYLFIACNECD